MNTHPASNESHDAAELRQECLTYLLGEMDAEQQAAFDSRLGDDEVVHAMEETSQLIVGIAGSTPVKAAAVPAVKQPAPVVASAGLKRPLWMIACLAAAVLLILGVRQTKNPTTTAGRFSLDTDDMEIAQAWAQPSIQWDDKSVVPTSLLSEELEPESSSQERSDSESSSEESLEWLVAAVQAAIELGDQNDG